MYRFILSFIFSLFFLSNLYGAAYDEKILNLHSKVFPKIILTDKKLNEKLLDEHIIISILYEKVDKDKALELKKAIKKNYPTLNGKNMLVELRTYSNLDKNLSATAYYMLRSDKEEILKASSLINKVNRISFSYDNKYLDYGVVMSLHIGKKVSPFINIKALKKSKIELNNNIFKVAKIK